MGERKKYTKASNKTMQKIGIASKASPGGQD
jgi:hypothetical protein